MSSGLLLALVCAVLAVLYGAISSKWILSLPAGAIAERLGVPPSSLNSANAPIPHPLRKTPHLGKTNVWCGRLLHAAPRTPPYPRPMC